MEVGYPPSNYVEGVGVLSTTVFGVEIGKVFGELGVAVEWGMQTSC